MTCLRTIFHRLGLRYLSALSPLFILLPSILLFCRCDRTRGNYVTVNGEVWNTLFSITCNLPEGLTPSTLRDSLNSVFSDIDNSVSVFHPGSLVCRINEGNDSLVDPAFSNLYILSKKLNRLTGGLFDPTAEPLIKAWGFGQGHRPDADTLRIDSILLRVGLDKTELTGGVLRKSRPGIAFNFSAVAKGYGCDEVAAMLERLGCRDYLVEIGGELRVEGVSEKGEPWRVALESPGMIEGESSSYSDIISLSSGGIATSSNLRNSMLVNGQRMGHVVSPLSGRPVESDILSATVVAPTCAEADGLATCCILLGSSRAPALLRNCGVSALLATPDSTIRIAWPPRDY